LPRRVTRSASEAGRPWRKLGAIGIASPGRDWCVSHAALPVVDGAGAPRLQFSVRDADGRSHIAQGDFSLGAGAAGTLRVDPDPVLTPGALGTFDDSGVTSSCLVRHGERRFLYYTGWTRGVSVPFYIFAGLAISDGDGPYTRWSPAPLLDRNHIDPLLTASPWVLVEDGLWRMWYVSATRWESRPEGPRHHYHVRYAESADGFHWRRDGHVCLDFASPAEYAFGRPCVIRDAGGYRMWYSYRGESYRIGYAESADGLRWTRRDDLAGIDVSDSGWDAEMIEYPLVVQDGDRELMFYNGNGYGRTGIGVAERTR
jgi:hypothetical protein